MCVVPPLDEVEKGVPRMLLVREGRAIDQLTFESGKEALAHRVVIAVTDRAHRRPDTRLSASPAELDRGVLATLVGMVDHSFGGISTLERHRQRVCD